MKTIRAALAGGLLAFLAACGGGGGSAPEPAVVAPPPVIGSAGGTVGDAGGASVIVPAGALLADTTIRVAVDATGAPPLPTGLAAGGDMVVITPHGGEFREPVEVRIRAAAAAARLQPNQELKLAKAEPGGAWEILSESVLKDGVLSAKVRSFSYFVPVMITYVLPLAQAEPFALTRTVDCGGQSCDHLVGVTTVTLSWASNGGALPWICTPANSSISVTNRGVGSQSFPVGNGSITVTYAPYYWHQLVIYLMCDGHIALSMFHDFTWTMTAYPQIGLVRTPAQVDVVAGLQARVDAVFQGGAARNGSSTPVTPADRAMVDWQRSDDNGASWRVVGRSYQDEADPNPLGEGSPWFYWGHAHGFVAAASDQGALIRVYACYTPPDVAPPPCVTGPPTRINVLQQSALPAIVDAPRSVLVKTGQTASFSATAAGAPAPLLKWQTRPANSAAAWADVSGGSGATTGSYTTLALSTANNGTQYRVVASNALGSTESAPVTVSVSDLDVAPTITTQPASLSLVAGGDAAFAIAARGTEALSYQWDLNGVAIVGANGPVLRLPAISVTQAGAYRVTVSNAAGNAISSVATLSVGAATAPVVAPAIVTQPVSVLVNAGNTATFAVGASGSGPLAYQWLRNGQPIVGATAAFHSIASAAIGDAATYSVQVSNGLGTATSDNVVLTVNASAAVTPVALQSQPSPQVQPPGGSAVFAVAVTGSGPIGYQWLKNGAPIPGATGAVLVLANLTGGDGAGYAVTVNNPLNSVTSDPATLVVLGAPVIGSSPAAANVTAGQSATFTVAVSGSALRYQWTRNAVAIAGATGTSYTTPALTLADSGALYAAIAYNGAGVAISNGAVLSVSPAVAAKAWGAAALIETDNAGNAESVQVAVNASGQAVAVWQQSDGSTINIYANRYAPGAGWGTPQRISPVVLETSQAPQVAIDGDGNAIAVWMQSSFTQNSGNNHIWASRYTAQVGWAGAVLIEAGPGDAGYPQIAIDGSGNAIVAFWQHAGGRIDIVANRYVNGAGWGTAAAIEADDSGDTSAPQIAMDAAGNAMVVWAWASASGPPFSYNVWANRYTAGSGWGSAGPIDSVNATTANPAPHVALDGAGNAIAVWHRPDGSWNSIWSSRHIVASGWGAPVLLETDNTNSAHDARIAFDASGNAMAVWIQSDGVLDNVLANRYTSGQGWGSAVLIETDNAGPALEPRIAFDGNGNATAAWSHRDVAGFTFNILANRWTAATGWGTAAPIDNAPAAARAPQLGVDGSGNVITVWSQSDGTRTNIWANGFR